jgi:4-carboxymuconolactone decarboxylase
VWASHLGAAIAAGVPAAAIAAVEEGRPAPGEHEAALLAFVDELCHSGTVSDRTFGAVHELLGTPATVELMLVVGYYTMLSYVMNGAGAC